VIKVEFGNPIVGGDELIREAIRSPNFQETESSVQGWRIARDGTATFYNVVIGSPSYTIDENGSAVFETVSADQIFVNGSNLSELLDEPPRGILALTTLPTNSSAYNGTEIIFGRIKVSNWDPTRQYKVGVIGRMDKDIATPTFVMVRCRYAWDSTATITSPVLWEYQLGTGQSNGNDECISVVMPFTATTQAAGSTLSLLFAFTANANGVMYQGTTYGRCWVEDCGPVVTYGTYNPATDADPVQQYTKTYSAVWTASYQGDGDNRNVAECYQGYYSSTNGNQYSLIGLPYSTIQADLSGATVLKTEIYLNNNHFYSNSGGTAYVGTHTYGSEPATASLSNVSERLDSEPFSYGQAKWFTVTNTIANNLKNNSAKGIALGPGPSNSQSYYGYFAGNGQSGEPQIRITYQK
jgi:hypothetical protein